MSTLKFTKIKLMLGIAIIILNLYSKFIIVLLAQNVTRYWKNDNSFISNYIYDILKIANDKIVVTTSDGVSIIEFKNNQLSLRNFLRDTGIIPNFELTKAEFFLNSIWIGTRGNGLYQGLNEDRWVESTQINNYISDKFITALLAWNNKLVIGTRSGLYFYDGNSVQNIIIPNTTFPIHINSLASLETDLYVATNQGLFKINPYNRITRISLGIVPEPNLDFIYCSNHSKSIIVAGEFGIIKLQVNDNNKYFLMPNKFQTTRFNCLYETEKGDIICGTARGLYVFDNLGNVINISNLGNLALNVGIIDIELFQNKLWLGTLGLGLIVIDGDVNIQSQMDRNISNSNLNSNTSNVSPIFNLRYFAPPNYSHFPRNLNINNTEVTNVALDKGKQNLEIQKQNKPAWTRVNKNKRMELSFYNDIYPVIISECMDCHTNGSGKYFPLNNPEVLLTYFRKAKLDRFISFCEEGGGMFGKVKPETINMLQMWVMTGCKE